jgi:hypothetical protein
MSRYENRRFSSWQRWVVQLSLAATATCALLGTAEYMGSQHAKAEVGQQQEWDELRRENNMRRVAQAVEKPWEPQPTLVISYPERPIGPLRAEVRSHQERSRDYGWLGMFSLFVAGSMTSAGFLRRRQILQEDVAELEEPVTVSYDPVPPRNEIDESLAGPFEPATYYGSNYGSEYAALDEMLDTYELPFMERIGARISALLARRRERIREQLESNRYSSELIVPLTNYIEPIAIDRN